MSAQDRGWSVAPTLVTFVGVFAASLFLLDGNFSALADRLTTKREPEAAGAGPVIVAKSDQASAVEEADLVAALPTPPAGSHDIGALDDVCIDGTEEKCAKWAMDGFYRAVSEAKNAKLGRALRVSWYGDSVSASDELPGRLRSRLQAELGDGGPGFVYILPPHRFCHHDAITRSGGDNFLSYAISTNHVTDGFYGPGGATVETNSGRSTIKLVNGKVTSAELYYLAQPKGGTTTIAADGTDIASISTLADAKAPGFLVGSIAAGATKFEIRGEGKTRLFGVSLENATGAVVDNFGIVSVHTKSFAASQSEHFKTELEHRSADLIIIMIGANEAMWLKAGDSTQKTYQAEYEKMLVPFRKARPDASCLVVSPSDQAEAKDDGYQSKPVMRTIADAQRKAAHASGCAFYSTYDWMGGKGSAMKWSKKHLIGGDFIHLTHAGASKMADGLFDSLLAGSKSYATK
ncbi:MAG TPA: GDSL-type esterase/lipase family protein [Kofleriaceae bacterium]|nr:GDSL-type esterase/lipase family protein [Kofleriaceae bacterium]